jgi:hypothetical protein
MKVLFGLWGGPCLTDLSAVAQRRRKRRKPSIASFEFAVAHLEFRPQRDLPPLIEHKQSDDHDGHDHPALKFNSKENKMARQEGA